APAARACRSRRSAPTFRRRTACTGHADGRGTSFRFRPELVWLARVGSPLIQVLGKNDRPVTARTKGERFTRWVTSTSNEQGFIAPQQFGLPLPAGCTVNPAARAPAGRRALHAGGRFSLRRTSCPESGARHPWRACRGPRRAG